MRVAGLREPPSGSQMRACPFRNDVIIPGMPNAEGECGLSLASGSVPPKKKHFVSQRSCRFMYVQDVLSSNLCFEVPFRSPPNISRLESYKEATTKHMTLRGGCAPPPPKRPSIF